MITRINKNARTEKKIFFQKSRRLFGCLGDYFYISDSLNNPLVFVWSQTFPNYEIIIEMMISNVYKRGYFLELFQIYKNHYKTFFNSIQNDNFFLFSIKKKNVWP